MPSKLKKSPAALVERFASVLPEHPAVVQRQMFGYPAAFANGNMACGLFQDSVVVRLGKEGATSAIADGRAEAFSPMPGRTMSGYVVVPDFEANDAMALAKWLQQALEFTLTLPKKAPKGRSRKATQAMPREND